MQSAPSPLFCKVKNDAQMKGILGKSHICLLQNFTAGLMPSILVLYGARMRQSLNKAMGSPTKWPLPHKAINQEDAKSKSYIHKLDKLDENHVWQI